MPTKPPGTPDLDLTDPNTFGMINDAVFTTGQTIPAGTANFNAFVQIQRNGSEQGYNTDASAQYDEKNSHNHNHSVLLAEVPIVFGDGSNGTVDGVAYREFLLDLNEPNGGTKPYISLDKLQIWQQEAGNLTNFTPGLGFAGRSHQLSRLRSRCRRQSLDRARCRHVAWQRAERLSHPDPGQLLHQRCGASLRHALFGVRSAARLGVPTGGFEEWGLHGESGGAVSALAVNKTATVPGGTADHAGEVITYSINVANVGNQTLTGITVSDPSVSDLAAVLSGGFNVGDVDHDNALDAGETWQYSAHYTVTQADLDSDGGGDGTIANTVTADSAQTAAVSASTSVEVESGASLEVVKTADVSSVDAAGDVINYTVNVTNTGTVSLNGLEVHDPQFAVITPVLGDQVFGPDPLLGPVLDGDYNAGDTNENGIEDPGETFQYAPVGDENQNGIEDNGEVWTFANIGDTNQNGAQDPGETFQFYNAGDTNHDGEENPGETFQFNVNDQMAGVDADHDGFNDGDLDHDGVLDVGETWQFTGSYTVTQDDIDNGGVVDPDLTHDNTATATTNQTTRQCQRVRGHRAEPAYRPEQERFGAGRHCGRGRRGDRLHDLGHQRRQHDADRSDGERSVGQRPYAVS